MHDSLGFLFGILYAIGGLLLLGFGLYLMLFIPLVTSFPIFQVLLLMTGIIVSVIGGIGLVLFGIIAMFWNM